MADKTKIISIIAIIFGAGLIPTGIGISSVINDEMAQSVPDALLGIQEEILPKINDTLKTMGIPDVLSGTYVEFSKFILFNRNFIHLFMKQSYKRYNENHFSSN